MSAIFQRCIHTVDRLQGRVEFERGTPAKTTWRNWAANLDPTPRRDCSLLEEVEREGDGGRGTEEGRLRLERKGELGETISERRRGTVRAGDQHVINTWDRTEMPIVPTCITYELCKLVPPEANERKHGLGRATSPASPFPVAPNSPSPTHGRHPPPFSPTARRRGPKGHRFQVNWPIPPSRLGGTFDTPVSSPTSSYAYLKHLPDLKDPLPRLSWPKSIDTVSKCRQRSEPMRTGPLEVSTARWTRMAGA